MTQIIKNISQGGVGAFEFAQAPTSTDDFNSGFLIGDRWIDTSGGNEYVLIDGTAGAAIWKKTTEIAVNENNEIIFDQTVIFEGAVAFASSVTYNVSGTVNNLDVSGLEGSNVLRLTGSGNVTGIKAPLGGLNQILYVFNVSGGNVTFEHNDSGSDPENRLLCKNNRTSQNEEAIVFVYDDVDLRWRMAGLAI